jgi:hypothetical protein
MPKELIGPPSSGGIPAEAIADDGVAGWVEFASSAWRKTASCSRQAVVKRANRFMRFSMAL